MMRRVTRGRGVRSVEEPRQAAFVPGQLLVNKCYIGSCISISNSKNFLVALGRSSNDFVICELYGTRLDDFEEYEFRKNVLLEKCEIKPLKEASLANGSKFYSVILSVNGSVVNRKYLKVRPHYHMYLIGKDYEMVYAGRIDEVLYFRPKNDNLARVVTKSYKGIQNHQIDFIVGQPVIYHSRGVHHRALIKAELSSSTGLMFEVELLDLPMIVTASQSEIQEATEEDFKDEVQCVGVKLQKVSIAAVISGCKQEFQDAINTSKVYSLRITSKQDKFMLASLTLLFDDGRRVDGATYLQSALERKSRLEKVATRPPLTKTSSPSLVAESIPPGTGTLCHPDVAILPARSDTCSSRSGVASLARPDACPSEVALPAKTDTTFPEVAPLPGGETRLIEEIPSLVNKFQSKPLTARAGKAKTFYMLKRKIAAGEAVDLEKLKNLEGEVRSREKANRLKKKQKKKEKRAKL